jgi:tetratricopeptide (TPR) repeat protein
VRGSLVGKCLGIAGTVLMSCGERPEAERVWQEASQIAERIRDVALSFSVMFNQPRLLFMDGKVAQAVDAAENLLARALDSGVGWSETWKRHLFDLGQGNEAILSSFELPARPSQAERSVILARLGRYEEARAIRERFEGIASETDPSACHIIINLLETAIRTSDLGTVRDLSHRLADYSGRLAMNLQWHGFGHSVGRHLGEGAVLLGQSEQARGYYMEALAVCEKVRFRPEVALIRLDLAELLLEHYPEERNTAIDYLDFAIAELRDMKMQPSLERALRHRDLLKA